MQELILLGLLDSWFVVSSKRKKVMKLTRLGEKSLFLLPLLGHYGHSEVPLKVVLST